MTAATIEVTEPGVYDMPAEVYHADPVPGGSLSASGARKLLPPSCPARFRYEQQHPPAPRKTFEIGTAAHRLVLGSGPELVLVDRDVWNTKAVKEEVREIREAGNVPLKPAEHDQVHAMAAALRSHPDAAALLDPDHGKPEQSLFWPDGGIWRRCRLDWLPDPAPGRRLIVPDYKTCESADLDSLERAINSYGYHRQGAWYLDGVRALGLADAAAFVLICQEKEPPYLVTVAQIHRDALRIGRIDNREAIDLYRECVANDHWPAHTEEVALVSVPAYIQRRYEKEIW